MSEPVDDEREVEQRSAEPLADPDAFGVLLDELVAEALVSEAALQASAPAGTTSQHDTPGVLHDWERADQQGAWSSAFGTLRSLTQPQRAGLLETRSRAQALNELLVWALREDHTRVMEQWLPYLHYTAPILELDSPEHFVALAALDLPISLTLPQRWLEVDDERLHPLDSPLAHTLHALRIFPSPPEDKYMRRAPAPHPVAPGRLAQLLSNVHLAQLRHLDVEALQLSAPALAQLGSSRLSTLRALTLRGYMTAAHVEPLLESPIMQHLHRLHLPEARLSPGMVERLTRWALQSPPRKLELTCWTALMEALLNPAPQALALNHRRCSVSELAELCTFERLGSLTQLELSDNGLDDRHAELLSHASNLTALRRLDLSFNHISDVGAASLATSPHLQHITHLNLRYNALSSRGVALLEARFGEGALC